MIKWLVEDWKLKLISFILAIGLWYYAVGEEGIEVTRNVPLDIKLENAQMSILKQSTKLVQVTLFAPRALLADLTSEKIMATHDIGPEVKTAGDYSFRLEPSEVKVPNPQVRVLKIEPETIAVKIDELMVQKLQVKPQFVGEPAVGYKVITEDIQMNPNAVLIEGPKGALEKMESVLTEKIDLVGRVRSFRRTVALALPDNLKALSEPLIDLYVPIQEEVAEKIFEGVPVKIVRASLENNKMEIAPAVVPILLKGAKVQIDKLQSQTIMAFVDVSGLQPGQHDLPLQLTLPEGVALKDKRPVMIHINIKK